MLEDLCECEDQKMTLGNHTAGSWHSQWHLHFRIILTVLTRIIHFSLTIRYSNLILKYHINASPSLSLMERTLGFEAVLKPIRHSPVYHWNRGILSAKCVGRIFILFWQVRKLMHRDWVIVRGQWKDQQGCDEPNLHSTNRLKINWISKAIYY